VVYPPVFGKVPKVCTSGCRSCVFPQAKGQVEVVSLALEQQHAVKPIRDVDGHFPVSSIFSLAPPPGVTVISRCAGSGMRKAVTVGVIGPVTPGGGLSGLLELLSSSQELLTATGELVQSSRAHVDFLPLDRKGQNNC